MLYPSEAVVSRYPLVTQSAWFEEMAGQQIAAFTASLPLETVAAARERVRARDWDSTVAQMLV